MIDGHSKNNIDLSTKKSFFALILHYLFSDEPKNRNDLLKFIRHSEENELINPDIRNMLEGVINIVEKRVRDIMIPRSQIVFLKKNNSIKECLSIISKFNYSSFPVINEDKDYVEGILIVKNLFPLILENDINFNIKKVLSPITVIPENKRVDRMLKEFCLQHYHMAVVIDEFGNTSGLVTIKDIIELIVGKIKDSDNKKVLGIECINKNTFSVHALISIEKFNRIFRTKFNSEEIDTIGGLIMQRFGHLPKIGESIDIQGYVFTVSVTNSRSIVQLVLNIPEN